VAPPEPRREGKVAVTSGRCQPGEAMEEQRRQPQMSRRRKAVLIDAEQIAPDDADAIARADIEDMPGFGDSDEIPFGA
jgi:hypothetical protein